jgi:hypothetical protein
MIRTLTVIAASAMLLAACGDKNSNQTDARKEGPVVATSKGPTNDAVDTTPTKVEPALSAGASSFTEAQARGAFEKAGYVVVGPLTQNANGVWQGKATKGGAELTVAIDYKGAITQP